MTEVHAGQVGAKSHACKIKECPMNQCTGGMVFVAVRTAVKGASHNTHNCRAKPALHRVTSSDGKPPLKNNTLQLLLKCALAVSFGEASGF